ncbi:MAG: sulfite exporter TauE/SafE family protein [Nitrospirae bacterium]|nr:sulfite exporter TauE/SafE family protein [Nitrospirota bacterium]
MLVALPCLSYFMSIKVAVPLLSLLFVLSSLIMTFQLRGKFAYRSVMPLLIGALFGIPVGIYFIIAFSEGLIKTTLGILLIAYSVYSLSVKKVPFRFPEWTGYLFGFSAGALGGAFNIMGPPVVFYVSTQKWSKANIVGSLQFFFLLTGLFVVAFHVVVGNVTREMTKTFLELLPATLTGLFAGLHIFKRMNEDSYRRGLFILLIIMGIMLLIRR